MSDDLPDISDLKISADEQKRLPNALSVGDATFNPWQSPSPTPDLMTHHDLQPIDSAALDSGMFGTKAWEDDVYPAALEKSAEKTQEILQEFDPVLQAPPVNEDEMHAWDGIEGHLPPPPPPIRSPPLLEVDQPETPAEASTPSTPAPNARRASISAFPSFNLSAIARTLGRAKEIARPASTDGIPQPSPESAPQTSTQQTSPTSASSASTSQPQSADAQDGSVDDAPAFDFQEFLEQMNMRSAEPVSKYLKSFLSNFTKRTFTVNDQIKIINDFLNFIAERMRTVDPWKKCSDAEFDNAMEGMEKLVMNRLYDFTFSPSLPNLRPPRPTTTDDLERDRVLSQRIKLFSWIEPRHLDLDFSAHRIDAQSVSAVDDDELEEDPSVGGFIMFAEQELLKISHYKAPRDKVICLLNCCKVIFGLIRHLKRDESADVFIPLLIYVVLQANPEHLLSNIEFINRFRNPTKLQSEAGYYLSSLVGAVSFIETMDHTSLSHITQAEFERNVEQAIQVLPLSEPHSPPLSHVELISTASSESSVPTTPLRSATPSQLSTLSKSPLSSRRASTGSFSVPSPSTSQSHVGEESATPLSLPTISNEAAKRLFQKTGDTFSKPLNAIGRILTEVVDGVVGPEQSQSSQQQRYPATSSQQQHWAHPDQVRQFIVGSGSRPSTPHTPQNSAPVAVPIQPPYKPRVRRVPSNQGPGFGGDGQSTGRYADETPLRREEPTPMRNNTSALFLSPTHSPSASVNAQQQPHYSRTATPALDIPGIQMQIDHATEQAAEAARSTLIQIFPNMDQEVIQLVLEASEGDLGQSIERLLEMGSGD
ncbi:hypothetical protein FISHEDRAFT_72180 [Fistulina hepatica ATCC 64428]|uniref:VPS9 domain-containing protein n=1 Tax=Fistulina hepatica ATCC 64428 TaxID=1128425 RepID=A0A0D7AF41_9AGAR|nr:hypothetical protein FISHEDRAFT_72180 [Fistulina hepatica ATCC 64428]